MQILPSGRAGVRVGDRVRGRGQRWLVSAIEPFDDCLVVTLHGTEAENDGVVTQLVSPADRLEPIAATRRLRIAGRTAWRRDCRTLLTSHGPPSMLRTAITARMQLLPYQLEPALAMVRGLGSRVLIADAVGLGKTVQAGLIVAELRARHAAARTLILTPAGLREQWLGELADRFDLEATLLDASAARASQRRLPVGVSPWSAASLVVTSTDYVKRPDVLRAVTGVPWDLVVVDEAHGCVSPSDRHNAVAAICRMAPHVALLTATPHSGDEHAFESLCGIGDRRDALLTFRRSRSDTGMADDRRIHQLIVRPTPAERRLRTTLQAFAAVVARNNQEHDERVALVMATLGKRALSSASSLVRSIQNRLSVIQSGTVCETPQLALPFDSDGELDASDATPDWHVPVLENVGAERAWLLRLVAEARVAAAAESKLRVLSTLLRRVREPIVVFTEYRDTLLHLRNTVAPQAELLHGGMTRDERRRALQRFPHAGVLLATDAAGEGLNLHKTSRIVVNLELPWNPMRLEQRIGRVDRIGQARRVHVFHLIAADSDELSLIDRLSTRISAADAAIGSANPLRSTRTAAWSASTHTMQLGDAAREEAARLTQARAVATCTLTPHVGEQRLRTVSIADILERAPMATRANGATRTRLRGATLAVVARGAETWGGHLIALNVVGVLWARRGHRFDVSIDELNAVAHAADARPPGWSDVDLSHHDTFWARRQARLAAIAVDLETDPTSMQLGLFDRRQLISIAQQESRSTSARIDLRTRIEAAARWRIVSTTANTVALLIVG